MASSSPFPEAGPSRLGPSTILQRPFKLANRHPSLPPFASSARFSTPARFSSPALARFRGSSIASAYSARPSITDEEVQRRHENSVQRLRTAWDLLMERYGRVLPEDDDEIDIFTEQIVVQRGKVAQLEGFEFGDISGSDSEEDDPAFTFEVDEDELSVWDERSGLDYQFEEEEEEPPPIPWTQEDDADLQSFLRAEQARREAVGERESTQDSVASERPRQIVPSPRRRRGTTILDEVESVQDDDTDDEVLIGDVDDERAMRGVPASPNASTSRSPSPLLGASSRRQSLPALPDKRADQAGIPKSTSAPTLRDLFTPPLDSPPDSPPLPQTISRKGKERMASERPNELPSVTVASTMDPAYYYQRIWPARDGFGLRKCKLCAAAGGEREKLATLCRGRHKETACRFANPQPVTTAPRDKSRPPQQTVAARRRHRERTDESSAESSDTEASEADESSSGEVSAPEQIGSDDDDLESVNSYSASLRSPTERPISPPRRPRVSTNQRDPPTNLDPDLHYPSLRYTKGGASTVRCFPCGQAGGHRAQLAEYCKGRRSRKLCPFASLDSGNDDYEADHSSLIASAQVSAGRSDISSGPETPAKRIGNLANRIVASKTPESIVPKVAVKRRARVIPSTESITSQTLPSAEGLRKGNVPGRPSAAKATSSATAPGLAHTTSSGSSPPSEAIMPSNSILTEPLYAARKAASLSTSSARSLTLPPSSPPLREVSYARQPSTEPNFSNRNVAAGPPSLPPSSPPFAIFPRASMYMNPTPSPSLSSGLPNSSPPLRSSPLASVARMRKRPYVLLTSMRPTPPPSVAGTSSSPLSAHAPLAAPPKGILRQPSEVGSTPHSAKRARFSLAPRSPAHEPTSDPLDPYTDEESDDELLLDDTDPVCSSSPSRARRTQSSSSSPFSCEMSMRAADLGLRLGPEPTGRLSSTMVAALTPSLSPWKLRNTGATLGSTIAHKLSDPAAYSLPTPPRSFGSTTSTQGKASPARSTPSSARGLMLPPPVPASRLSARPLTPASDPPRPSPESTSVRKTSHVDHSRAEQLSEEPDEGIVVRRLPRAYLNAKARARSRSLSMGPRAASVTPMRGVSVRPSTTPRRRSRLERDLARVAREVTDDAGLEWGLDEDVGEDCARSWRESSVIKYVI